MANDDDPKLDELRALLVRAGSFPRPMGNAPHRRAPYDALPEGVRESPVRDPFAARSFRYGLPGVPRIDNRRRSPIDVRRDAVRGLRDRVVEVVRRLLTEGRLPAPSTTWLALIEDDLLDEHHVGQALRQLDVARLRRMQPAPPTEPVAEQVEPKSTRDRDDLQSKVDRAVALLMRDVRDGGDPRSARAYCKDVGIRHPSTLLRHKSWQAAQTGAAQATQRTTERQGSRDAEGNVDAWLPAEPCENCCAHAPLVLRTHQGAAVRVCEACAGKLGK